MAYKFPVTSGNKKPKIGKAPVLTVHGGLVNPADNGPSFLGPQQAQPKPKSVVRKPPPDNFDLNVQAHKFTTTPLPLKPQIGKPKATKTDKPAPKTTGGKRIGKPTTSPAPAGSPAPAPVGGGKSGGKPPKIGKPAGGKTTTTTSAASTASATPGAPSADSIYAPAFGALDTAGQRLEAGRQASTNDLNTYGQWAANQEAQARDWLGGQFQGSADAAAKGYQDLAAGATQRAADTAQVSGGNADLERLSGIDTAQAQQAAQAQANQANAGQGALSRAALARQFADQTGVRDAYLANLRSGVNAGFNDKLAGLDTNRAQLTVDKGKLAADLSATAAKNALDQKTYQLLAAEKMGNLQVAQTNANTKRLQVLTTADAARERARLTAEIASRRLDIQSARLQMDQYMKGQGLTLSQRRLELQKLTQDSKNRTSAASLVDNLYDKTYGTKGTRVWDQDPNKDRQFVRQLITSMHARYPNLSQAEAVQIISGRFPGALRVDPNDKYPLLQQVRALWQQ